MQRRQRKAASEAFKYTDLAVEEDSDVDGAVEDAATSVTPATLERRPSPTRPRIKAGEIDAEVVSASLPSSSDDEDESRGGDQSDASQTASDASSRRGQARRIPSVGGLSCSDPSTLGCASRIRGGDKRASRRESPSSGSQGNAEGLIATSPRGVENVSDQHLLSEVKGVGAAASASASRAKTKRILSTAVGRAGAEQKSSLISRSSKHDIFSAPDSTKGVSLSNGVRRNLAEGDSQSGNEDRENLSSESDSEETLGNLEPKVLPARLTRGRRYNKVMGEEAEKDASFWGHETWADENEDEEWSTEDERHYRDVVDSDFGATESDEAEGGMDDEDDEEAALLEEEAKAFKKVKINSAYRDPRKAASTGRVCGRNGRVGNGLSHKKAGAKGLRGRSQPRANRRTVRAAVKEDGKRPRPPPPAISISVLGNCWDADGGARAPRVVGEETEGELKTLKGGAKSKRSKAGSGSNKAKKLNTQEDHLKEAVRTERETTKALAALIAHENWKKTLKEEKEGPTLWRGEMELHIAWASDRLIEHEEELKKKRKEEQQRQQLEDIHNSNDVASKAAAALNWLDDGTRKGMGAASNRKRKAVQSGSQGVQCATDRQGRLPPFTDDDEENAIASTGVKRARTTVTTDDVTFPSPGSSPSPHLPSVEHEAHLPDAAAEDDVVHAREMMFFINFDSLPASRLPAMYSEMRPEPYKAAMCAVYSDRPAKYRDPYTEKYYSDIMAFRLLRERAENAIERKLETKLDSIGTKLRHILQHMRSRGMLQLEPTLLARAIADCALSQVPRADMNFEEHTDAGNCTSTPPLVASGQLEEAGGLKATTKTGLTGIRQVDRGGGVQRKNHLKTPANRFSGVAVRQASQGEREEKHGMPHEDSGSGQEPSSTANLIVQPLREVPSLDGQHIRSAIFSSAASGPAHSARYNAVEDAKANGATFNVDLNLHSGRKRRGRERRAVAVAAASKDADEPSDYTSAARTEQQQRRRVGVGGSEGLPSYQGAVSTPIRELLWPLNSSGLAIPSNVSLASTAVGTDERQRVYGNFSSNQFGRGHSPITTAAAGPSVNQQQEPPRQHVNYLEPIRQLTTNSSWPPTSFGDTFARAVNAEGLYSSYFPQYGFNGVKDPALQHLQTPPVYIAPIIQPQFSSHNLSSKGPLLEGSCGSGHPIYYGDQAATHPQPQQPSRPSKYGDYDYGSLLHQTTPGSTFVGYQGSTPPVYQHQQQFGTYPKVSLPVLSTEQPPGGGEGSAANSLIPIHGGVMLVDSCRDIQQSSLSQLHHSQQQQQQWCFASDPTKGAATAAVQNPALPRIDYSANSLPPIDTRLSDGNRTNSLNSFFYNAGGPMKPSEYSCRGYTLME